MVRCEEEDVCAGVVVDEPDDEPSVGSGRSGRPSGDRSEKERAAGEGGNVPDRAGASRKQWAVSRRCGVKNRDGNILESVWGLAEELEIWIVTRDRSGAHGIEGGV